MSYRLLMQLFPYTTIDLKCVRGLFTGARLKVPRNVIMCSERIKIGLSKFVCTIYC